MIAANCLCFAVKYSVEFVFLSFCWFNFGAWFHINNIERFVNQPSRKIALSVVVLYLSMALIEVMIFSYSMVWYHNCVLLVGMLLFFVLPVFKISNALAKFGGASFFMYCMHEMVIRLLELNLSLSFGYSINYLLVVTITVISCLLMYHVLKLFMPQVLNLLTGSR